MYGRNTQNQYGDTVCWSCKGDAFACECIEERQENESEDEFRTRARLARLIEEADSGHEGAREAVYDMHEAGDHRLCR